MFLSWRITDHLEMVTSNEFDKDYSGIFGYMKLQLGDYSIGYILDETVPLEGNSDISYYISELIECGIAMYKREQIEIALLNYNLLKICVLYNDGVTINIIDENGSVEAEYKITFNQLIEEIELNYNKLFQWIKKENSDLFNTNIIKNILVLYSNFQKMLILN